MSSSYDTTEGSIVSQDPSSDTRLQDHIREPTAAEPTRKGRNRLYYCAYCAYVGQSTTNIRLHLQKHSIYVEASARASNQSQAQSLQALYNKATIINQTSELDSHILKKVLNKDLINSALISLIIIHNLPFRLVESQEFHSFCQTLNPEAQNLVSSHSTLKLRISKSWSIHKDIVRKKLQSSLSTIHLALDVWTSPNQKLFLGICAHFIDIDTYRLTKALIGLPSISSHHSEVQHSALLQVLQEFKIYRKLGTIISDNASSNDKLCRLLSSSLEKEEISWNILHNRIRCNGHIINLAVQAFLFQQDPKDQEEQPSRNPDLSPISKLHNIVVHIRGSPSRLSQFKELAGRIIPLDNSTRWNSWYKMIQVALEKESAIDSYSKAWLDDLRQDFLSLEDWAILRLTRTFLTPFYRATKATEGDQATIDHILLNMDILVQHFKESLLLLKQYPFLIQQIQRSWVVFDKYYLKTDESPYYVAAILLHPGRKADYLKHNWPKKWITPAIQSVQTLWNSFKIQDTIILEALNPIKDWSEDQDLDSYDRIARKIQDLPRPQSMDEYDEYLSEPIRQIQGSVIAWWLNAEQRSRWPKLSQLAINILSIPAMSAEPERVFSGARRTISWERMQLGEDTIEMLECLKHWIRSGLTAEVGYADEPVLGELSVTD